MLRLDEVLPPPADAAQAQQIQDRMAQFDQEPFLLLEWAKHGDMQDFLYKCVLNYEHLTHAQLWRIFSCRECLSV